MNPYFQNSKTIHFKTVFKNKHWVKNRHNMFSTTVFDGEST